jgi:hypothetical protein
MTDQEREILIHRLIGGWALDYHVLMPSGALDVIEHRLFVYFQDSECATAKQERERCATLLETKQVISSSVPPHWRLVDDADPDVPRKTYAAAIRALPDD